MKLKNLSERDGKKQNDQSHTLQEKAIENPETVIVEVLLVEDVNLVNGDDNHVEM